MSAFLSWLFMVNAIVVCVFLLGIYCIKRAYRAGLEDGHNAGWLNCAKSQSHPIGGMSIADAFRSGKPVRRSSRALHKGSSGKGWVDPRFFLGCCTVSCTGSFHLTIDDITATDWEVMP